MGPSGGAWEYVFDYSCNSNSGGLFYTINEKTQAFSRVSAILYGGERGIRTLETLLTLTHFPGVLLQPLGHLTVNYCNSSLRCRQTVILPSQTFQAKPPLKLACRADLSAGNCTQIDL